MIQLNPNLQYSVHWYLPNDMRFGMRFPKGSEIRCSGKSEHFLTNMWHIYMS